MVGGVLQVVCHFDSRHVAVVEGDELKGHGCSLDAFGKVGELGLKLGVDSAKRAATVIVLDTAWNPSVAMASDDHGISGSRGGGLDIA